jgi:hypothetical protein
MSVTEHTEETVKHGATEQRRSNREEWSSLLTPVALCLCVLPFAPSPPLPFAPSPPLADSTQ